MRGPNSASLRMIALVWRFTQRLSEMTLARIWGASWLAGLAQSAASTDHSRRFQSRASIRAPICDASVWAASISAFVTWPKSRYSMSRGDSARWAACWYAWTDIPQPLVLVFYKLPAEHQRLVVLAGKAKLRDIDAIDQNLGIADRTHELGQPLRELVVVSLRPRLIEVHHHHREIDPAGRRVRLLLLHDVLLAQHGGLVLQHENPAAVPVLDHGPVEHEFLAGLQRQLERHVG